jgi:hypothetical protein
MTLHRITLGTVMACTLVLVAFSGAGHGVSAQDTAAGARVSQKKYKATRPLAVDRETRKLRMPTQEEVDGAVQHLLTMTTRPTSVPEQVSAASGITAELQDGFSGVVLTRPNEDGTWETKCVFTFDEGIEFLGFVPEQQ